MIKCYLRIALVLSFLLPQLIWSQHYSLNASELNQNVISGHLEMGNSGPGSAKLEVNNRYLTLSGKPIIPVMGEVHFSRLERQNWKDVILKMKANGINIVATYLFWNHHEEIEGQLDWTGSKDFRSFVKLCGKHNLWVYPRLGPWCHGEVRNGGTPDWILSKDYMENRSNHPAYQEYVERWYSEIAKQMNGLYYKDGGPIIGVQLENEYWRGRKGEGHILWLKETARKYGIDVPLYTVTGWRKASVPEDEVIPLWGGYPAVPWATNINPVKENPNFVFETPVNIENIGNEESLSKGYSVNYSRYPYFTCEIGVGNQISYHRRPVIGALDGYTIATVKTGSGSNLPGYYVFAGGSNPIGILTTLEEEQNETGYWNEYPVISYDFQAAIRETGELAPSYHQVKKLHYFLNEFGERLAPLSPVISTETRPDDLQYAIRSNGRAGFLFMTNYYRGLRRRTFKNVQFKVKLKDETLTFPSQPVTVSDSTICIWPFNFEMNNVLLKYATVQPVARINKDNQSVWIFFKDHNIAPELAFDASEIENIDTDYGRVEKKKGLFIVSDYQAGKNHFIEITGNNGHKQTVVILTEKEADCMWLLKDRSGKHFFISDANMYLDNERLHVYGQLHNPQVFSLNASLTSLIDNIEEADKNSGPLFDEYNLSTEKREMKAVYEQETSFDQAVWIKAAPDNFSSKNELYHKLFVKEFSLLNPSRIKSAVMTLFTDVPLRINVNKRWLAQRVDTGKVVKLDFTGYVSKGNNVLLMDVPFVPGDGALAANIRVDYFNSDEVEINTDGSWLTTDEYRIPVPGQPIRELEKPVFMARRFVTLTDNSSKRYIMAFPDNCLKGLDDVLLRIDYAGNTGSARLGHRLVADNFNNGEPWSVALGKFYPALESQPLELEITPLSPSAKIYFENESVPENGWESAIKSVRLDPVYSFDLKIE
jgi:hypothetical protein